MLAALTRHYDELVDSVRRRFGCRHVAREVVHDVCVQVLEREDKDDVRIPLALLHKIAHDRAISVHRSERRRRAWTDEQAELLDLVCQAPGPERHDAGSREFEQLCAAIASLPPRCQTVFVMHKIHEIPQRQVAEQLGISIKAVEKHVRVGTEKCLAWLGYRSS